MNKEQNIWLLVSTISVVIFMILMEIAFYGIRFKYDVYIIMSISIIIFVSFIMYAFTQYVSTREMVSILVKKLRD